MVSSAAYADSNIKINVDDANRVSIKVNGVALNNIVNGENNIPLLCVRQPARRQWFYH